MKHAMLHQIDEALPTEVIVGSSTSSFLLLDMIQECSRAPERFVLSHPFNRAHSTPPPRPWSKAASPHHSQVHPASAAPHAACRAVRHGRRLRGQGNCLLPLGGSPSDHDEQAAAGSRRQPPDLRHLPRGGLDAQGGHREPSRPPSLPHPPPHTHNAATTRHLSPQKQATTCSASPHNPGRFRRRLPWRTSTPR